MDFDSKVPSSSPSSSSAFPTISLGFTFFFGEIFAYVTGFFLFVFFLNPTTEVVTFRLRG